MAQLLYPTLPDDPDNPYDPGDPGGGTPPPPQSGYGTLVMQLVINKIDGISALDITAYLNCYSADDLRFSAYIFVDDTLVQAGSNNFIFDKDNSKSAGTLTVVAIAENVPAGQHTINLRIKNRENEAALNILPGSIMKCYELRKPAM